MRIIKLSILQNFEIASIGKGMFTLIGYREFCERIGFTINITCLIYIRIIFQFGK